MAKLDTGSSVNIMRHAVFSALQMKMDVYDGQPLRPLGEFRIIPLGQVNVDWHVGQKSTTYTSQFVILDDSLTDFDVLLGEDTINEVSFYIRNDTVWVVR